MRCIISMKKYILQCKQHQQEMFENSFPLSIYPFLFLIIFEKSYSREASAPAIFIEVGQIFTICHPENLVYLQGLRPFFLWKTIQCLFVV